MMRHALWTNGWKIVLLTALLLTMIETGRAQTTLTIPANGNEVKTALDMDDYDAVTFAGAGELKISGTGGLDQTFTNPANGSTTDSTAQVLVGYTSIISGAIVRNPANLRITNGSSENFTGMFIIEDDSTLTIRNTSSADRPLGAYWTGNDAAITTQYATTQILGGGTLTISADTKIGALSTDDTLSETTTPNYAIVNIANSKATLTVYNGLVNGTSDQDQNLLKTGEGAMIIESNLKTTPSAIDYGNIAIDNGSLLLSGDTTDSTELSFGNLTQTGGDLIMIGGEFSSVTGDTLDINNGTMTFASNTDNGFFDDSSSFDFNNISVKTGGILNIQKVGDPDTEGDPITVNNLSLNGGTAEIYVKNTANGIVNTSFEVIENATISSDSDFHINLDGSITNPTAISSIVLVDSLETIEDEDGDPITSVNITDDLLGWDFTAALDDLDSPREISLSVQASTTLSRNATTANARSVALNIESNERANLYSPSMRNSLLALEANPWATQQLTGEIYATAIGFEFLNSYLTIQQISQQMRSIPLVTYTGGGNTANPMTVPGMENWRTGGANTAPYGPGYAPVYETGQPMSMNSVFDDNILRGQTSNLGDPGTLIYSAWATYVGGTGSNKSRNTMLGFDTERAGGIIGLDLFCSTDCRTGLFGSYQQNKIKEVNAGYGHLKADDALIGAYHQFGDEFVYNLFTLRGGYSNMKVNRNISFGSVTDSFSSKAKAWQAGISAERGANFQLGSAFVISPYVGADYTYLHRQSFTEDSVTGSGFALSSEKRGYHSLHSVVGATAALHMYPGNQQLSFLLRGNWTHEFLDSYYGKQTMTFSGINGPSFDIYGNSLGRDWALVGFGAEWIPIPALLIHANWDYLRNKYTSEHLWAAGATYRW